jgi:hypothetical protein
MSKMIVDLKVGESLLIGGTAVRLEKKSGQLARLVIEAEQGIKIKTPARMSASPTEKTENTRG